MNHLNSKTAPDQRFGGLRRLALIACVACAFSASVANGPAAADGEDKLAGIPKSEYAARRQKLMQQLGDGVVVLIGAREEDLGEVGRFRQKNDFMYLTGVQTPAAQLILAPAGVIGDKPAQETVFIPARNLSHERWTGVQLGPGPEAERIFGIQEVAASDKFKDRLAELLNSAGFKAAKSKLYTIVPKGATAEIERETHFIEMIRKTYPHVQIADVSPVLAEMRKVKSAAEIALLQKAVDVSLEGHREVARAIRPGAFEYEAQAALDGTFTRLGSERPGYPSIVGAGINGTTLHYNENRKRIEAGELVVVDAAAEYSYYTADITRTYPASGKFTQRQKEIYQLVLDAQRAAEKAYVPGKSSMADLQQVAKAVMKASPLRDKEGNTLDNDFIHGLGHYIGMDVHDTGAYGVLPVNSVITIEPGIYLPSENFGVRIEDDYLVTPTGLVKMSAKLPCEVADVERLMSSRTQATYGQH
jgi:Xaa-Pro aminopeptidase